MQRLWLMTFGIVSLLGLSVQGVNAQGGNIVSIVNSRSDLETLAQFIEAAPEVRNVLLSEPVTLLAPTDTAFENLASALNTPLSDLIGSLEIVTALLNYHTLDGVVTESTLRNRAGQVVPTRLTNAFVGISINAEDQVVVNNVVEITTADLSASNGRVHILNDVLLNRVIDDLIEDLNFEDLITPNVTDTPTEVTPSPNATVAVQPAQGQLRVAHLSPDIEAVNVRVEDEDFADALTFSNVTDFIMRRQGIYTIEVLSEDERVLLERDVTLLNEDVLTIVVLGSLSNDTLDLVTFNEDFTPFEAEDPEDTARLTVIHALEDAPNVDIYFGDELEIENLAFRGFEIIDIAVSVGRDGQDDDLARLLITESGDEDAILFSETDDLFVSASYNLVLIYGTDDDDFQLDIITVSDDEDVSGEATVVAPVLVTNTPRPSLTPRITPTASATDDD